MSGTFEDCSNIVNAPIIPNSVTYMSGTFEDCSNIVNAPIIPNSVTYMFGTFSNCYNLKGNVYIQSENITNAYNCFYCAFNTPLTKNVYIPFKYENGEYTKTYNSFINVGYNENGTKHNVYLKNIN